MSNNPYSGIAFPPQRGNHGFFAAAKTEEELISGNIYTLLRTHKGEMPGVPEFGNSSMDLLFEPMNPTTRSILISSLKEDIALWEPRVTIESLTVIMLENTYKIKLVMRVKATGSKFEYADVLGGQH